MYERDGLPCHDCGNSITRETVASRRLYRCPRCQPG
ncbi:zinc finger domain-containing protein [Billgrantia pellis]|nr:zinc finger domain-containing protein [Halomonas pellis]